MKHVVFGGCSFTQSGDSWAFCARPLAFQLVTMPTNYDLPSISAANAFAIDYIPPDYTAETLINQRQMHLDYSGFDDPEYEISTFIRKCNLLDVDQYKVTFGGIGAGSVSLTARSIINYLEKNRSVDTVVFQISGFARREVLTMNDRDLQTAIQARGDNEIYKIESLTFIKQNQDINVQMVKGEPDNDRLRLYSAYYSDYCADIEEFYVRSLDQLQLLSLYCKSNNIKLGYFHGWDNLPDNWSSYSKRKYDTYVKPYLLTDDNILDYYRKKYPNKNPLDYDYYGSISNLSQGNHPNCFAHREFWNDIVEPFVTSI